MRKLLLALLVLSFGVAIVHLAAQDPGFVVIGRGSLVLEAGLAMFIALLLAAFLVFYLLLRLIVNLWELPERLHSGNEQRNRERRYTALVDGFSRLMEGQWKRAEQNLVRTLPGFLHYLGAAYAAQQRGDLLQRDAYLAEVKNEVPAEYLLPAKLAQVRLHMAQRQFTDALGILHELREDHPRHPQILALLKEIYLHQESWTNLYQLLPELRKRKVTDSEQTLALEGRSVSGLLHAAAEHGEDSINHVWNNLAKVQRLNPGIAATYSDYLRGWGRHNDAETVLRDSIRQHWHADTVKRYGVVDADKVQQLNQAEKWLKGRERDAVLLLTLGRLCMRNRLWGKAMQYLESSLTQQPAPETYQTLGELHTQIGENLRAAEYYLKGLQMVTGDAR